MNYLSIYILTNILKSTTALDFIGCVCRQCCGSVYAEILVYNFVSGTPSPTTHLAPRSLCMRRTALWRPGSSGCGKSLIRWACGGQWRVSSLSMNTDCLMSYSCSWAQLFSNCERLMFWAFCVTKLSWYLLHRWLTLFFSAAGPVESWTPEKMKWRVWSAWWPRYLMAHFDFSAIVMVVVSVLTSDWFLDPRAAGWGETGLGDRWLYRKLVAPQLWASTGQYKVDDQKDIWYFNWECTKPKFSGYDPIEIL